MTSNLGSHLIQSMAGREQKEIKDAVMGEVQQHFRPEFINRIDEIVVFHALDDKNIGSIARIQLDLLNKRLVAMDMSLETSDAALHKIADAGFDPLFGARPLKRAVQNLIENPLSKEILEGRFGPGDVVQIEVENDKLAFKKKAKAD